MAEGDAQLRVPPADAAGDHRGAGEADVARKADRLLDERADDALLAGGPQRMHEDRRAELLGRSEERLEARIADRHAIHVACDLNAGQREALAVFQLANRRIEV